MQGRRVAINSSINTPGPAMNLDIRPFLSTLRPGKLCRTPGSPPRMHAIFQPPSRLPLGTSTFHTCFKGFAICTTRSFCKTVTTPNPNEDFFRYTSGRWLWDEEHQLRDRYRAFNVGELQSSAAKAIGSDDCVSMTKLAEGGYNKVFRLLMNDGKTVLARIPNPNAGPPFYTTASEVATMEFVSSPCFGEAQEMADVETRPEVSSKSPFLKYWNGVPHLITLWAPNISSWKRRLGHPLEDCGTR